MLLESTRFWQKVNKNGSCWVWMGTKHAKGYGHFSVNGSITKAHRWSWEEVNGPIPPNMTIDHVFCNNPPCVNPAHMEVVTREENTRRARERRNQFGGGTTVLYTLGEKTQSLKDWCKEFPVAYETLLTRMKTGMSLEDALKIPVGSIYRSGKNVILYELDGRRQTLPAWSEEYEISYSTVLNRINNQGMTFKEALTAPLENNILHEIDGQSKTIHDWCLVFKIEPNTIYQRIQQGYSVEESFKKGPAASRNSLLELNGQFKSLVDWCKEYNLPAPAVRKRISKGQTLEQALTTPLAVETSYTINGVTKNLQDWAREYGVDRATTYTRIQKGMSIEDALAEALRVKKK